MLKIELKKLKLFSLLATILIIPFLANIFGTLNYLLNKEVLQEALADAHEARLKILDVITSAIYKPREDLSKYAPRIFSIDVDPEKVRDVIGAGGKIINKIIEQTGVKIDIDDDGRISILSESDERAKEAIAIIEDIVKEIEVGEVYTGKVKKIVKFGAFVELKKGTEGLLHISEIAHERTNSVDDVLKVGDTVEVKVIDISDDTGKISLSRKALLKREDNKKEQDK